MNSEFVVFDSTSPYDAVMGEPLLFSLRAALSLYYYSIKFPTPHGEFELISLDQRTKVEGGEPVEELERVQICADDPSKELKVGRELHPSTRSEIVAFLRQNLDIFAWNHRDMRGIDPKIASHKLQVVNPVFVKKHNGEWRVCIDFTDLNKACPKDSFSLPRIDQMVDTPAGHELLNFMDA
ncbi:uncharacterized protein LOC111378860 [Olea europaea var. sylvestris]|uniref:uncharacterized protein LOC111378860 n=1 Tax=Olea europaea var. sylvestris TaxID=158386 RepID=UPI000C1D87A8|nr:uncharacterized protein LOC111378860 [Olea europaea var. sylvestris]